MKKIIFVIAVSITLCSCIKENTPGPQGPRGPQGPPGRDGSGTQVSTYYFKVYPDQWKNDGIYGTQGYYCYVDESFNALTNSVIERGAILAYMIADGYDHQLPYILPFNASGYFTRIIRYDLQEGKIGFIVEDSDFRTPLPPFTGMVEFKVVIINGI